MSTTDMIDVEVILTLSVPIHADPAEREDIYGTSNIEECMQIDFDNDPYALLMDSTVVNMEIALPPPPPPTARELLLRRVAAELDTDLDHLDPKDVMRYDRSVYDVCYTEGT